MTINIWWLLPAFMAGGFFGYMLCALMVIAKQTDELMRQVHDKER